MTWDAARMTPSFIPRVTRTEPKPYGPEDEKVVDNSVAQESS